MKYVNDYVVTIECEFIVNCLDVADAVLLVDNVMSNASELSDDVKVGKVTCNEVREAGKDK